MYKNRIYLASPFFTDEQRDRIDTVVTSLRQNKTNDADGIFIQQ